MRKLLALVLCAVMVFALCACGSTRTSDVPVSESAELEPMSEPTPEPTEDPDDDEDLNAALAKLAIDDGLDTLLADREAEYWSRSVEKGFVIKIKLAGMFDVYDLSTEGDKSSMDIWKSCGQWLVDVSNAIREQALDSRGLDDYDITIMLLSDAGEETTLYEVVNGEITFDALMESFLPG